MKKSLARDAMHHCLTENEITLFMNTASEQGSVYMNLYTFLLNTGLRIGEAGAITPADVKEGTVMICKTVIREGSGYVIRNKTKTGWYIVELNEQVRAAIHAEMSKRKHRIDKPIFTTASGELINTSALRHDIHAEMSKRKHRIDKPIFTTASGELINTSALRHDIQRICKAAGIEPFAPCAFRATFAYKEFMQKSPEWQHSFMELAKLYKEATAEQREAALALLNSNGTR